MLVGDSAVLASPLGSGDELDYLSSATLTRRKDFLDAEEEVRGRFFGTAMQQFSTLSSFSFVRKQPAYFDPASPASEHQDNLHFTVDRNPLH